eukprot:scaffold7_cov414-Pavlova_lutheri.AAC.3
MSLVVTQRQCCMCRSSASRLLVEPNCGMGRQAAIVPLQPVIPNLHQGWLLARYISSFFTPFAQIDVKFHRPPGSLLTDSFMFTTVDCSHTMRISSSPA